MCGADNTMTQDSSAETKFYDVNLQEMLLKAVRGGPKVTDAHLRVIEKDFEIDGTKTTVHCYAPRLDGNGRMRINLLAQFLRDRVVEYAIPRKTLETAQAEMDATGSPAEIVRLHEKAKRLFIDLKNTGEGGEFLLFALAEAVLKLAQILCKMSLKTSTSMHYHGADGVYASGDSEGNLNIYWGESKLYENPIAAITDCLKSLAPFLREELGDDAASAQDIFLVNEFADFSDPNTVEALRRFFDQNDPHSNKLRLCGIALVGFDCEGFPNNDEEGTWETIEGTLKEQVPHWGQHVKKRVEEESLAIFDIHFICVPMRSVEEFRQCFLKLLEVA